jgi:hypothetical protein
MSRWLTVAEGLFRGRQVGPPPPFEVVCRCGRTITGQRTNYAQVQICPDCHERLFVLPSSVYPQPRAPKRKLLVVPHRTAALADPDETASGAATPAGASPAGKTLTVPPPAKSSSHQPAISWQPWISLKQSLRGALSTVDLDRLRRKIFNPVRLVLAGVALVVSLTFWWIWHLQVLSQAERTVVSAARQGELALADQNLEEAARQFQQVRMALDKLGRTDSRARSLRQTAAELTAAAALADDSLFDMFHDASQMVSNAARESWADKFQSNYRGRWVVLDAWVSRSVDTTEGHQYDVDFHLVDGANQAVIIAQLPAFEMAISRGDSGANSGRDEPMRVIFAAQLEACVPDPIDGQIWRIVLRPTTGFLWSSVDHLELVGIVCDDDTKQLLAEQTNRLGIAK